MKVYVIKDIESGLIEGIFAGNDDAVSPAKIKSLRDRLKSVGCHLVQQDAPFPLHELEDAVKALEEEYEEMKDDGAKSEVSS